MSSVDPLVKDIEEKTRLQKHSPYYPEQKLYDKFYMRNAETFAISMYKKTYSDTISDKDME